MEMSSLDGVVAHLPETMCLSQDLLMSMLVEEKSEAQTSGQSLEESVPQMIGESLVV